MTNATFIMQLEPPSLMTTIPVIFLKLYICIAQLKDCCHATPRYSERNLTLSTSPAHKISAQHCGKRQPWSRYSRVSGDKCDTSNKHTYHILGVHLDMFKKNTRHWHDTRRNMFQQVVDTLHHYTIWVKTPGSLAGTKGLSKMLKVRTVTYHSGTSCRGKCFNPTSTTHGVLLIFTSATHSIHSVLKSMLSLSILAKVKCLHEELQGTCTTQFAPLHLTA